MNVYKAACVRIDKMLSETDYAYVSFSGGKDSGVLLNLVLERADKAGKRIGIFHIDYEAQYQATTDYVRETLDSLRDKCDIYHFCVPIAAQCCTSMSQDHWLPWEKSKKEIWCRDMPARAITEENAPTFFKKSISDYEFQTKFARFIKEEKGAEKVAAFIGIRTQESLRRWVAINSETVKNKYGGTKWANTPTKWAINAYPIFDWTTEDIWIANAKFGWKYNRIYDLFYQAGVPLNEMRVASPFNDAAPRSLKYYRAIEPDTWAKMIGRVNGVNFTGLYGGTAAMGWKKIKKPKGFTWKQYAEFLLKTLPPQVAENYRKKLETSIKFWREKGAGLKEEIIKELSKNNIVWKEGEKNGYSPHRVVKIEEYPDDLGLKYTKELPSYKRFCICIMKNDHECKFMGFGWTKKQLEQRKAVLERYKGL